MAKFAVDIKEVHDTTVIVDTAEVGLPDNPTRDQLADAAEQIQLNADDLPMEYNRTLEKEAWTIRNTETGNYL